MTLFPENMYTRHRDATDNTVADSSSMVQTSYAGTPTEPWKVASLATVPQIAYSLGTVEMDDVEVPDFRKRMRRGEIFNNPMESLTEYEIRGNLAVTRRRINRSTTTPYYYSGSLWTGHWSAGNENYNWCYPDQPYVNSNSAINEAVTEAFGKVSANQADILVELGESRQTIGSLVSILKRVLKIKRAIFKLRLKELGNELSPRELANRYMELRYALRPLVYSSKALVDVLCNTSVAKRQTFRGWNTRVNVDTYDDVVLRHQPYDYTVSGNQKATRDLSVRSGVLTQLDNISTLNRWGATEIFQSAWELVPLSFVVDWFWNIGAFIASWTPKIGFKTLASWYVVTDTTCLTSTAVSAVNLTSYNYWDDFAISGSYSKVIVQKYRLPDPSRPTLPTFNLNLDWLKTLDLGIILKGLKK